MYKYAKKYINVPSILFCDRSKQIFHSTYAIIEYVESDNLRVYSKTHSVFQEKIIYKIAEMLAILHKKTYKSVGILDEELSVVKDITPFNKQYEEFLSGKAGEYLSVSCKSRLFNFVIKNPEVIERITEYNTLSHGDLNFSNILIDHNMEPWFIDFEYTFSCSMYYDIGKFFRTKEPSVQANMTEEVRKWFFDGYNSQSQNKLPPDWYVLSKLADVVAMLALINRENIPSEWIAEIEEEIVATINLALTYYAKRS